MYSFSTGEQVPSILPSEISASLGEPDLLLQFRREPEGELPAFGEEEEEVELRLVSSAPAKRSMSIF